jgi:hypothetical protein
MVLVGTIVPVTRSVFFGNVARQQNDFKHSAEFDYFCDCDLTAV